MKRLVALLAAAAAAAGVFLWSHSGGRRARPAGPIVLISIDTLRADHLAVYGYTKGHTPNIDALARDAVVFDHAYAQSPQTLPAHVSLLSGQLPFETSVRDNIGFTVKPRQRFIQGALGARGYRTGGFVSAYVLRSQTGVGQGFEVFDSNLPAASPEASIAQVQRDGALTVDAAIRWLDGLQGARPFFLFVHLYEPHTPYTPPARFSSYAPYDGEIAYADELVGRVLDRLRGDATYGEATIVLLSDHGEGLGDHGEQEHGLFLYDETIRIPVMIKMPRQPRAGTRIEDPIQQIDLAPTLLDLAGAPADATLRGRSLAPWLLGTGQVREAGIYSEALYARYHFGWSELYALTDARYRFIQAPREELYDLRTDPGERQNLAETRPGPRAAMRDALARLVGAAGVDRPSPITASEREQFQALGYVSMQADLSRKAGDSSRPDPKDKVHILEQYRRAVTLASNRGFDEAIAALRTIVAEEPEMADVWSQLAVLLARTGRTAESIDAYRRFVTLRPEDPSGLIGVAAGLMRLGRVAEARDQAQLAARVARDARGRAEAQEILARIAIADGDWDGARASAREASAADPSLPLPEFVEGVILYRQNLFEQALPHFAAAIDQARTRTLQVRELHYYAGDALARLQRYPEAEREFRSELRVFPGERRGWAGLAMLYRASGRDDEAARAIEDMLRVAPGAESYSLAARLWTIFGEPARADAVRAQARRRAAGGAAR